MQYAKVVDGLFRSFQKHWVSPKLFGKATVNADEEAVKIFPSCWEKQREIEKLMLKKTASWDSFLLLMK